MDKENVLWELESVNVESYYRLQKADERNRRFGFFIDCEMVGMLRVSSAINHKVNGKIGYSIRLTQHGKRYSILLLRMAPEYCNRKAIENVTACVDVRNITSIHSFHSSGFVEIGRYFDWLPNPLLNANLRPIQKGELFPEEAKKRGSAEGKKSGKVRRMCRDAKKTIHYIMELDAVGNTKENLKRVGIQEEVCTNMTAAWVKCYTEWLRTGNIKLLEVLMKYGGFDEAELRKARCLLSCPMTDGVLLELLLFMAVQQAEGRLMLCCLSLSVI